MVPVLLLTVALATFRTPQFTFDPPAPDSHGFVYLRMRVYIECLAEPVLTRNGNTFEVEWPHFPPGGGCGAGIGPVTEHRVPLGVLPAGEYDVKIKFLSDPPITKRLSVAEGEKRMTFAPPVLPTSGGELTIHPPARVCFSTNAAVTIGGLAVPAVSSNCSVTVTAPPHDAGAADVTVTTPQKTYVMRSTLRYADAEDVPVDETAFERVLVPVLFSGNGQFGSRWVTDASVVNRSQLPVYFAGTKLLPGVSQSLSEFGNRPNGLLLFLPRASVEALDFDAIVRDVSREESSWGAEVPVVRERDFGLSTTIRNVPLDRRYRTLVRVYGIDQQAATIHVTLREGQSSAFATVDVYPGSGDEPAFAAFDPSVLFPRFAGKTVSLTVQQNGSLNRYWAFASVTSNATQNVTIITP